MTRTSVAIAVAVAAALAAAGLYAADYLSQPAGPRVMDPGWRRAFSGLLPGGPDEAAPEVAGFEVLGLGAGPGCRVTVSLGNPRTGARAAFDLVESAGEGGSVPGWTLVPQPSGGLAQAETEALATALAARILSAETTGALSDACRPVPRPWPAPDTAVRVLLGLALFSVLAAVVRPPPAGRIASASRRLVRLWRSALDQAALAAERLVAAVPGGRGQDVPRWAVVVLVAAAGVLHLALVVAYPPHFIELQPLTAYHFDLSHLPFGPPLHGLVMAVWSRIGEPLGLGIDLVWLRLPNVALGAVLSVLMVRCGRLLGAPWAGFFAAVVLAFMPGPAAIATMQEHYFAELVTVAWFLDRALAYVAAGEKTFVGLAASAAVAAWTGHMTLLIVGPALLMVGVVALRRGQLLSWLLAMLAFTIAYSPVLGKAVDQAAGYAALSGRRGDASGFTAAALGHPVFTAEIGPIPTLRALGWALFGESSWNVAFCVAAAGLSLMMIRLLPAWVLGAGALAFITAGAVIFVQAPNTTALWPAALLLPLAGAARIGARPGLAPGNALAAVVVLAAASVAMPGYADLDRLRVFPWRDVRAAIRPVLELPPAERRLVSIRFFTSRDVLAHAMCKEAKTYPEFVTCSNGLSRDPFDHPGPFGVLRLFEEWKGAGDELCDEGLRGATVHVLTEDPTAAEGLPLRCAPAGAAPPLLLLSCRVDGALCPKGTGAGSTGGHPS